MKILLVKTSSLGDIIHVYPVLSYLKTKFPDAEIDFVVEKPFADIVKSHPLVTKTIEVDTKEWRKSMKSAWKGISDLRNAFKDRSYDLLFDLQGNFKSGLIVHFAKAREKIGFGFKTTAEWPNALFLDTHINPKKCINIREEYLSLVRDYFKDHDKNSLLNSEITLKISEDEQETLLKILSNPQLKLKKKIMVCPGTFWKNKQISEEAIFKFLECFKAIEDVFFIFVQGSQKEKELVDRLNDQFLDSSLVLEKMKLPLLQNLMSKMDLVIAMDSLPLHLAGTTNVSTYSFFGPSLASKYMPIGPNHFAFQGTCPYEKKFEKRCPMLRKCSTGACLKNPTGDALFQEFSKVFKKLIKI